MIDTYWEWSSPGRKSGSATDSWRWKNSLIRGANPWARNYRSKAQSITIIYLIVGKLLQSRIHTI